MNNLTNTYECKADAKGRIKLSSHLIKHLTPVIQDGFILKRSIFQSCLELHPMAEWNVMLQRIKKLNRFSKKNNSFIRAFLAGVKTIDIDASGRVLIPKDLLNFAGISKDVVLAATIDNIEIWDKERYEKSVNSAVDDFDDFDDFADLAEHVMGSSNDLSNLIS